MGERTPPSRSAGRARKGRKRSRNVTIPSQVLQAQCQESDDDGNHGSRGVPLLSPLRVDQSHKHEGDEERHEADQTNVSCPTMNGT